MIKTNRKTVEIEGSTCDLISEIISTILTIKEEFVKRDDATGLTALNLELIQAVKCTSVDEYMKVFGKEKK